VRIVLTLDRDASRAESNDYLRALREAGFAREEIAILPPGALGDGSFDGLVLGGGGDVDPARYGHPLREDAGVEVDSERDATDFALFEQAWRGSLPILGICRGLQVVNVALGGTLVQDLPSERPSPVTHQRSRKEKTGRDHVVKVAPGTRLRTIAGANEIPVNSRHHQAIETPASDLRIAATAPDGVIEAAESGPERWLLAVQWHPENLVGDPVSEKLFAEFARVVHEGVRGSGRNSTARRRLPRR
jgi:gamma-glutamyl-gamma-aminobutyrate hydrolase PuuD